jgi:hypothetical protein
MRARANHGQGFQGWALLVAEGLKQLARLLAEGGRPPEGRASYKKGSTGVFVSGAPTCDELAELRRATQRTWRRTEPYWYLGEWASGYESSGGYHETAEHNLITPSRVIGSTYQCPTLRLERITGAEGASRRARSRGLCASAERLR